MPNEASTHPQTDLLHHADDRNRHYGAVNTPVYRASLFGFERYDDFVAAADNEVNGLVPTYTRVQNPTRAALEAKVARLEKTDRAIAFSSGMGAISAALLAFLRHGDHALFVSGCYGPTRQFATTILRNMGVEVEFYHPNESTTLANRLQPNTRLIYLESPGSLTFQLQDIQAVTKLARQHNIVTVIDNSWATPLYQQPVTMGIDVVVHSGTKYISGHSDVVVGLLACNQAHYQQIKPVAMMLGANLSPDDAYLVTRGLRTLPIRLATQQAAGLQIARWLAQQPQVLRVLHPGLPDFPNYELGRRQMSGASSLFAFQTVPATAEARAAFVDALRYFTIAVSWGGFESLILPIGRSYRDNPDVRQAMGLDDDTYRICIGLEDPADLMADLAQGLRRLTP